MLQYLLGILGVSLGACAVVYGGYDDSPGLQLIGLLLVLGAIGGTFWQARRGRGDQRAA